MKMRVACLLVIVIAFPASAHPGKTDRQGGHRCLKDCAEWDLYYNEYHLHDKNGKAVRVAKKKQVRTKPEAAPVEVNAAVVEEPVRTEDAMPPRPVAASAEAVTETETPPLPWILLALFLLLFLVVSRNRRKASGAADKDK